MSLASGWASAADLPALRDFTARTFGPDSLQAAPGRLEWLCAARPGDPLVAVCRDGGAVVAACCHLPARVALGERELDGAWGVDFMVDAERRGAGIGRRLLALRLARFAAGLSSGQSPAMSELYRRAGGAETAGVMRALFVRRPPATGGPKGLARDWFAWGLGVRRARGAASRRRLAVAEAATRLVEYGPRLAPDEAGTTPDPDLFRWRYGGPVYADYACWEVSAGAARGLVVTRLAGEAEMVVDVVAPPAALPDALRAIARTSPAARLWCVFAGARPAAALRAAGWLVRPLGGRLVTMSADPDLARELAGRPWVVFAGDSDLDLLRPPAPAAA